MNKLLLAATGLLLCFMTSCQNQASYHPEADVVLETTQGTIELKLYEDTPQHRENFLKLVRDSFYNDVTFHRVIESFMIQAGDPQTAQADFDGQPGSGGPGYTIPAEINSDHIHKAGALAAARQGDQVNPERASSGSQFFIVTGDSVDTQKLEMMERQLTQIQQRDRFSAYVQEQAAAGQLDLQALGQLRQSDQQAFEQKLQQLFQAFEAETGVEPFNYSEAQRATYLNEGGVPMLDLQYTIFGEVVEGMPVVQAIQQVATDQNDRPEQPVRIEQAFLVNQAAQ